MARKGGLNKPTKVQRKPTKKQQFISGITDLLPGGTDQKLAISLYNSFRVTGLLNGNVNDVIDRFNSRLVYLSYRDVIHTYLVEHRLATRLSRNHMGTTRRRDSMEIMANGMQGTMGEIAIQRFLKSRFGIEANLDFSIDKRTADYVPTDLVSVVGPTGNIPVTKNVSIKSTKFGGVWLDILGKQKEKSDLFVMTLVGTTFDTLIQLIDTLTKDPLFKLAEQEALSHYLEPSDWIDKDNFLPIPVYIAGIATDDSGSNKKAPSIEDRKYRNGKFKCHEVVSYQGWLRKGKAGDIEKKPLIYYGIKSFTKVDHWITSLDRLQNSTEAWKSLADSLTATGEEMKQSHA